VQRHAAYTRARIAAVVARLHDLVYGDRVSVGELEIAGPTGRISPAEADRLTYRAARLGEELGPLWATFWLRGTAVVPADWRGSRVDLRFSSHSEATLWVGGRALQGLNEALPIAGVLQHVHDHESIATRTDALLLERAGGGERVPFTIEIACYAFRGEAEDRPFRTASPFRLDLCELARFDAQANELAYDLDVLAALERVAADPAWRGRLLAELNSFCNECDPDDRATWPAAAAILKALLAHRNGTAAHELTALGHGHVDTAFLWPAAETVRKCIRTFSSQLRYMERYPEYRFTSTSPLHYAWVKERAPELWERIRARIDAGQWIAVGATWIEPDCNLPSGESLVRQFLAGQRCFERELGGRSTIFWNPDAFGYAAQLPQIMRGAGVTRFLTQKPASNQFSQLRSHSFVWEGLDGSRVTAHVPPAGTFNTAAEVATLRGVADGYLDHDRSAHSLLLFGHGDGGGGPTPRMLEILRRTADLEGLPRVRQRPPEEFFAALEAELERDPLVVVGELFFERHQGTYTSQARTKRLNRRCERALHDAELACALAHRLGRAEYPRAEIAAALETMLLHQFHDVLPGCGIGEVHAEAERDLTRARAALDRLAGDALARLADAGAEAAPFSTAGHPRLEVAEAPDGTLVVCETPPCGAGGIRDDYEPVTAAARDDGSFVLENRQLRAVVAPDGSLVSLVHRASGREALSAPGNRLELYDDRPTRYDAWDIDPFHLETRRDCPPARSCELRAGGPLRAEIAFERAVGAGSTMRQVVRLDAEARRLEVHCELDWHERHRLLKVAFPVRVHAPDATFETQFGAVRRPTHYTTPYDLARYEVPAQRFCDLSEHGFGVALLTDSKYGYSAYGDTLRVSLVRAPTRPDPEADQGAHEFGYAIVPHAGGWQEGGIVAEAESFTTPLRFTAAAPRSFARVDDAHLVLDTVKLAEDGDDVILRLYEAHGARGTARVVLDPPPVRARRLSLLEDDAGAAEIRDGVVVVPYRPFEIVTLAVSG
jgi:alpha-mannosidase